MAGKAFIEGFTEFLNNFLENPTKKSLRGIYRYTKKAYTELAFEQVRKAIEDVHGERIFKALAPQLVMPRRSLQLTARRRMLSTFLTTSA